MRHNQALRVAFAFGLVGLLIIILTAYVERNTLATYQNNLPYIRLGDNIKNRSTQAHLWFEELMAGDGGIDFDRDVLNQFKVAQTILQGAYDGEATELGTFSKPDNETREHLKVAVLEMEGLIKITNDRWRSRGQSADGDAGGELDEKFDAAYERVMSSMNNLVNHINEKVNADSKYLNTLSWVSLALITLIFIALCLVVYRLQFRNQKLQAASTQKLEEETKRVEVLSNFIEAVSAGNYDVELDQSDSDGLTSKLITMRNKLRTNAEEEKIRNWSTKGEAQIGEILRSSSGATTELYDNIIKFVVKYTKSNQGGLFLLNDEQEHDQFLELVSCYAFERKKFLTKKVELGQGLVGQCFAEGARIYLLEIPEEYINITSGLGGTNPSALLLVPLKVNEQVFGVIELASFSKFSEYEIELVEKFAESIASTISSVKVNESTRMLLEKTQQQTEEMRAQEEEMRQNMEELEATQEEMRRKEKHIQDMLEQERIQSEKVQQVQNQLLSRERVLSLTTILSEADAAGTILFANDKLSEVSKYSRDEMIGRGHNLFRHPDMPKELFKLLWDTIKSGNNFSGIIKNKAKDGTHYWVDAMVVPIMENGVFKKYVSARYHIKDEKMALELYNQQADRLGLPRLSA